jgi:hypothetical protein
MIVQQIPPSGCPAQDDKNLERTLRDAKSNHPQLTKYHDKVNIFWKLPDPLKRPACTQEWI